MRSPNYCSSSYWFYFEICSIFSVYKLISSYMTTVLNARQIAFLCFTSLPQYFLVFHWRQVQRTAKDMTLESVSLSLSLCFPSLSHNVANFTSTCTAVSIMKQQQEAKKNPFNSIDVSLYTCVCVCVSTNTKANLYLAVVVPSVSLFSHGLSAIFRLRQNRNVASSSRFANLNTSPHLKLGVKTEE